MRERLAQWVRDADALDQIHRFRLPSVPAWLSHVGNRRDGYYTSLVGELFERIRDPYDDDEDWARLGNALTQAGTLLQGTNGQTEAAVPDPDTALFAASAFYFGGYPASAYLTLESVSLDATSDIYRSCHDLLARPTPLRTSRVAALLEALRTGDLDEIRRSKLRASTMEREALESGPDLWVGWRLFSELLAKFELTNIRATLPNGGDAFWDPLVSSFLARKHPVWDFFPSQIQAIRSGLLENSSTYSLQMPTGSGKTALTETLLFWHLGANALDAAIMLVPYRSLASELRRTLVARLQRMGVTARCVYGGTVPPADEIRELHQAQLVVGTPEALSGLLSASPEFLSRVNLVICDEGHLLDGGSRGVGLELLLTRMRSREPSAPKFVFISAIVPNIEEVNAWLGGDDSTVVRSDYRPALAEFSLLVPSDTLPSAPVDLEVHPQRPDPIRFSISSFLSRTDFRYWNEGTRRYRTHGFGTFKTRAIAAARKALPMGAVAVFAANKLGTQGVVGLAEELLRQLEVPLPIDNPLEYVKEQARLRTAVDYFEREYGDQWIGTRVLAVGVVLHHGDVPQESREVIEELVAGGTARMAICTNTLAEGVNLPIRTLILYSVKRRGSDGRTDDLLARDIKNLVGRAGRPGSETKGLVICANPNHWSLVEPVARGEPGEEVSGALLTLMLRLRRALGQRNLTNAMLEATAALHTLVDGIDATLIELAAEELGEEELGQMAREIARQTFAAHQATDPRSVQLVEEVFALRARRVEGVRQAGRLAWIRDTGARVRMLESVEESLLPLRTRWDDIETARDPALVESLVQWAWDLPDMRSALEEVPGDWSVSQQTFTRVVDLWLDGAPLVSIAERAGTEIDTMLWLHGRMLSYVLQVLVEQGVAILGRLLETEGRVLAPVVMDFPDHLRFGVSTSAGRILAAGGVRHRRAACELGESSEFNTIPPEHHAIFTTARALLEDEGTWLPVLGRLVFDNTLADVASGLRRQGPETQT